MIYGDADQDDIIGGSRGARPADGGDTILGNTAQDVDRRRQRRHHAARPCPADAGPDDDDAPCRCSIAARRRRRRGGDCIQGNDENDDVYAGGGGDLVHGDAGDDYVEGNGGSDGDGDIDTTPDAAIGLYGDVGQDDLIGGTSQGDGGVADGADDIWGGQGHDVATGDNADITRHRRRHVRRLRLQHVPRRRRRRRRHPHGSRSGTSTTRPPATRPRAGAAAT